jgi:hypothetical protein
LPIKVGQVIRTEIYNDWVLLKKKTIFTNATKNGITKLGKNRNIISKLGENRNTISKLGKNRNTISKPGKNRNTISKHCKIIVKDRR